MKALVGAFNQEKALVGAFSVITNLRMELLRQEPKISGLFRAYYFSSPGADLHDGELHAGGCLELLAPLPEDGHGGRQGGTLGRYLPQLPGPAVTLPRMDQSQLSIGVRINQSQLSIGVSINQSELGIGVSINQSELSIKSQY